MAEEERGSLAPGALVGGRFRVERIIGRGGMGEVYAARHTQTGKEVALKMIRGRAGSGQDHVRRFLREARAATAIEHPNVIEVFDVFADEDDTPVMVMELLKGETLSTRLARAGAFRVHEAATILVPACRALQAAHAKSIVHRDLKPDNVFLATTGSGAVTTKLLDFGIAKVLDPTMINSETQGQHTNTGSILGTPHYMSYEQAMSDKNVDHRTDVWSMGVIVFEALTGRRPLSYDTLGEMYSKLLQGTVPSIREFLPDVPGDLADVLDRCLAKLPQDRLADIVVLADVLERYTDPNVPGGSVGGQVVTAPVLARPIATGSGLAASADPLAISTAEKATTSGGRRRVILLSVAGLAVIVSAGSLAAIGMHRPAPPLAADPASAAPSSSAPPVPAEASAPAPNPSGSSSTEPVSSSPALPSAHPSALHLPIAPPSAIHPALSSPTAVPPPQSSTPTSPVPPPSAHKGLPTVLPY